MSNTRSCWYQDRFGLHALHVNDFFFPSWGLFAIFLCVGPARKWNNRGVKRQRSSPGFFAGTTGRVAPASQYSIELKSL